MTTTVDALPGRSEPPHLSRRPDPTSSVAPIRVAFAGHNRPEDLGDLGALDGGLRRTLELLKSAGAHHGELFTGLADGADLIAARAWSQMGFGPIHAVFPYLGEQPPTEFAKSVRKCTWLDGDAIEAAGRNAHLMQTRWLIEDADLLIVVWGGEAARGAGGTADAVRVALERGVPVLWVRPREPEYTRIISPDALDPDFGFLEFLEQLQRDEAPLVELATAEHLHPVIARIALPPPDTLARTRRALGRFGRAYDAVLDRTIWRIFALYRRVLAGSLPTITPLEIPPSLSEQPGFRILTEAYDTADMRATRLAAVHRSQQVFQAGVMILAAAIGSAPAVWPSIKFGAVLSELALALATLAIWASAVRSERSRRWGEARRLSEQLRLERAAWALGVSTRDTRHFSPAGPAASLAWRWRRLAGAPEGRYDVERVQSWGGWALGSLLDRQIEYHDVQGKLNSRLSHSSHRIENTVFFIFIAVLAAFAMADALSQSFHFPMPQWVGGVMLMAGAVTPAFGAASLALEASLSFAEQGRRSEVILRALDAVRVHIKPDANLDALQRAARAAIRLQVTQEERWSEDTAHRHVVRGG